MKVNICKTFFLLIAALMLNGQVHAAAIDYIFTGLGTGSLDGTSFNGDFEIDMVGDTGAVVNPSVNNYQNATTGTFSSGLLNATLTNSGGYSTEVTLNNSSNGGLGGSIGFTQLQPAPVFAVDEAVFASSLEGYGLATAFSPTSGTTSAIPQTYLTDIGNLTFSTISGLEFEAVLEAPVSSVPLPASLPMLLIALTVMGVVGRVRFVRSTR